MVDEKFRRRGFGRRIVDSLLGSLGQNVYTTSRSTSEAMHRRLMRYICHKTAWVPGSQPRPGSIIARSTAHRPETRRNRAHFAARTRRNFLSFFGGAAAHETFDDGVGQGDSYG
jgi:hypothetical protein